MSSRNAGRICGPHFARPPEAAENGQPREGSSGGVYGRASRTMLKGVSVARRSRAESRFREDRTQALLARLRSKGEPNFLAK